MITGDSKSAVAAGDDQTTETQVSAFVRQADVTIRHRVWSWLVVVSLFIGQWALSAHEHAVDAGADTDEVCEVCLLGQLSSSALPSATLSTPLSRGSIHAVPVRQSVATPVFQCAFRSRAPPVYS